LRFAHLKPFGPVTVPVYGPLSCSPGRSVRLSVNVRFGGGGGTSAIATVTRRPAIVAVIVRPAPVLAAAVSEMLPLPRPDAGDTVSPFASLTAVHSDGEQFGGDAVSVTVCEPPPDANDSAAGETANSHATVTDTV
jgi:hypothetical protein